MTLVKATCAIMLTIALVPTAKTQAQRTPYIRLVGTWIKANTGERINVSPGGVNIVLHGQQKSLSGPVAVDSCSLPDANFCISAAALRCAFHYEILPEADMVNFVLVSGDDPCSALTGDYRRGVSP